MSGTDLALPSDKEYHAMFSFHSEDRVWVRKTLETLEAEPYGLKCCISDRDFHPGQDVLHNIETCMQRSMTIILVISPEHLSSHYCDFETNMAMEIAHQKQGRVIPVLRRGDNVPSSLRFINYIDARDEVDGIKVLDKLIKAINQGLDTMATTYTLVESSASKANDEEVSSMAVLNKNRCCQLFISNLPLLAEEKLSECRSLGIQLSDADNCTLNRLLNDCQFIRDSWILFTHAGRLTLWVLLCVVSGTLVTPWILWVLKTYPDDIEYIAIIMYTGVMIGGGSILFGVITKLVRRSALSKKDRLSGKISQNTYNRNFLVCIGNKKNEPVVRFVAYDVTECQARVKQKLLRLPSRSIGDVQINEITCAIIKRAVATYVKVLIYSYPYTVQHRSHMANRNLMCLCQYIELENIHLKVLQELALADTLWHDLSRLCHNMCCQGMVRSEELVRLNDTRQNDVIEV